jgi:hypothetical protein
MPGIHVMKALQVIFANMRIVPPILRCKINSEIEGKQRDFTIHASHRNFLKGYENVSTF